MKKHICMIAYSNYRTDTRIRREAETLASLQNYKVTVLSLKENDSPKNYFIENVEVQELNIAKYRGKNNGKYLISYIKFMFLAFFACNRLMIKQSLDIVHVHNMPNFLIFSAIIPLLLGKKTILDIHDTMVETYSAKFDGTSNNKILYKILQLEEAICCGLAHKIISVNHIQRKALIQRGIPAEKIIISMNAPDPKYFGRNNKTPYQAEENSNAFRLVYHGTLAKRLGIDLTICAIARLAERIPELEFHIMGRGDDVKEFIELIRALGMGNKIHFSTSVPLESLVDILSGMQLGVISNRKSTATELMLPVKMLEYVALDIPVIAPRLKTIQHYFSDDMVIFFEPENIDSLAQAILFAYNNRDVMAEKARNDRRFLEQYGWETHKFELINMYKSLS
jgi:glycosyltransferase involved in cell wall biosynthesis